MARWKKPVSEAQARFFHSDANLKVEEAEKVVAAANAALKKAQQDAKHYFNVWDDMCLSQISGNTNPGFLASMAAVCPPGGKTQAMLKHVKDNPSHD